MAILEDREEASCLQHYILSAYEPSFQRFAISLRAPFTMPGIYHWLYPNGSLGRDTNIEIYNDKISMQINLYVNKHFMSYPSFFLLCKPSLKSSLSTQSGQWATQ